MINEFQLEKEMEKAINNFVKREIEKRSKVKEIAQIKYFDKGSKLLIERNGKAPIEIVPEKYVARAVLNNDYLRRSDFDMVKAFFSRLAEKMAEQQFNSLVEEMGTHAGHHVEAKGDILGGYIEAAKKLRENGYEDDLILIMDPKLQEKFALSMMLDPERAEILKKLVHKERK
jgi:hypothetical protein